MKRVFYVLFIVFTVLKTIAQNHVIVGYNDQNILLDSARFYCTSYGTYCNYSYIKTYDIDGDGIQDLKMELDSYTFFHTWAGHTMKEHSSLEGVSGVSIAVLPNLPSCFTPSTVACPPTYTQYTLAKTCSINTLADTNSLWANKAYIQKFCSYMATMNGPQFVPTALVCGGVTQFPVNGSITSYFAFKRQINSHVRYGWFKIIFKEVSVGGTYFRYRKFEIYKSDTTTYPISVLSLDERSPDVSSQFKIYPNPASLSVSFQSLIYPATISIYSVKGEYMYEAEIEKETVINLESFASGLYVCRLKNREGVFSSKLTVFKE